MQSSFIHLPHRTLVSLRGPDTIALLERLVTNATTDWSEGETRYGALLTPQGKVIADYLALRTADGVWLDVAKDHASDLAKRLKMFRLRSQVDIDVDGELVVLAGLEAGAGKAADLSGAAFIYDDPRYADGRVRCAVKASAMPHSLKTIADYHADRIAHLVPEQGTDFGAASVFPADINMDILGGVALNKGCFVGQEVVSRMHRRGKIRKRTLHVHCAAPSPLQSGQEIKAPLPIGTITSAASDTALATVRVDRLITAERAGEPLLVDETPVTIEKPAWLRAELTPMEDT